jgi:drug/metabolite transporter (DMT)-like permease
MVKKPSRIQDKVKMLIGLLLVALTGLCWSAVGAAVSYCSKNGGNYSYIQGHNAFYSILISLTVLTFVTGWPDTPLPFLLKIGFLHFIAGIGNYVMFILMGQAMKKGHNGIVWALVQSGMIWSFLMGVFFFDVELTFSRGFGIFLILLGIALFGVSKNKGDIQEHGKGWLLYAFGAFILVGAIHCCNNLPSYLVEAQKINGVFRSVAGTFGTMSCFLVASWFRPELRIPGRRDLPIAITLLLLGCLSGYFLVYNGLNRLAEAGAGSIGFPIMVGVCIAGFTLYSVIIMREKNPPLLWLGFIATIVGIIFISLK